MKDFILGYLCGAISIFLGLVFMPKVECSKCEICKKEVVHYLVECLETNPFKEMKK